MVGPFLQRARRVGSVPGLRPFAVVAMSAVMGSPITRHDEPTIGASQVWRCHVPEGDMGPTTAALLRCHHCRIGRASDLALGVRSTPRVNGDLAALLGVPVGTEMPSGVSLRVAAELTDDVAVLRMLDRIEAS